MEFPCASSILPLDVLDSSDIDTAPRRPAVALFHSPESIHDSAILLEGVGTSIDIFEDSNSNLCYETGAPLSPPVFNIFSRFCDVSLLGSDVEAPVEILSELHPVIVPERAQFSVVEASAEAVSEVPAVPPILTGIPSNADSSAQAVPAESIESSESTAVVLPSQIFPPADWCCISIPLDGSGHLPAKSDADVDVLGTPVASTRTLAQQKLHRRVIIRLTDLQTVRSDLAAMSRLNIPVTGLSNLCRLCPPDLFDGIEPDDMVLVRQSKGKGNSQFLTNYCGQTREVAAKARALNRIPASQMIMQLHQGTPEVHGPVFHQPAYVVVYNTPFDTDEGRKRYRQSQIDTLRMIVVGTSPYPNLFQKFCTTGVFGRGQPKEYLDQTPLDLQANSTMDVSPRKRKSTPARRSTAKRRRTTQGDPNYSSHATSSCDEQPLVTFAGRKSRTRRAVATSSSSDQPSGSGRPPHSSDAEIPPAFPQPAAGGNGERCRRVTKAPFTPSLKHAANTTNQGSDSDESSDGDSDAPATTSTRTRAARSAANSTSATRTRNPPKPRSIFNEATRLWGPFPLQDCSQQSMLRMKQLTATKTIVREGDMYGDTYVPTGLMQPQRSYNADMLYTLMPTPIGSRIQNVVLTNSDAPPNEERAGVEGFCGAECPPPRGVFKRRVGVRAAHWVPFTEDLEAAALDLFSAVPGICQFGHPHCMLLCCFQQMSHTIRIPITNSWISEDDPQDTCWRLMNDSEAVALTGKFLDPQVCTRLRELTADHLWTLIVHTGVFSGRSVVFCFLRIEQLWGDRCVFLTAVPSSSLTSPSGRALTDRTDIVIFLEKHVADKFGLDCTQLTYIHHSLHEAYWGTIEKRGPSYIVLFEFQLTGMFSRSLERDRTRVVYNSAVKYLGRLRTSLSAIQFYASNILGTQLASLQPDFMVCTFTPHKCSHPISHSHVQFQF